MKSKFILLSLVTSMAGFLALPVAASVTVGNHDNVQIGGFFSQGYLQSSGNNYPFEAKDGTTDFREMGVNVSTTLGTHLRLGGQLFAQTLGNYGEDKVRLDWAVADYNVRQEFGIRVGRVKYPKGLYGEALDLDVVRPFIFLPTSIYNPILRDFSSGFNGAMVYGSVNVGHAGSVDYKAFYGKMPLSPNLGVADFFNTTNLYTAEGVQHISIGHVTGGQLVWATPVNGLKFALSYSVLTDLDSTGKFAYVPAVNVSLHTNRYSYTGISSEYVFGQWTFAGEYQRNAGTFSVITPFSSSGSPGHVNNWYVSVARRLSEKFEVGAYYAEQKNGTPTAGSLPSTNYNRDWALSIKCDLSEHVTCKLEGHSVDGRYNLFNTVKTPNPNLKDSTTFFAAKTTFSF